MGTSMYLLLTKTYSSASQVIIFFKRLLDMLLARHSITSTYPTQILDAKFDADSQIFTAITPTGFAIYNSWPLKLLRKRGHLLQIYRNIHPTDSLQSI